MEPRLQDGAGEAERLAERAEMFALGFPEVIGVDFELGDLQIGVGRGLAEEVEPSSRQPLQARVAPGSRASACTPPSPSGPTVVTSSSTCAALSCARRWPWSG